MRYIWDMKSEYMKNLSIIEKILAKLIFPVIKNGILILLRKLIKLYVIQILLKKN